MRPVWSGATPAVRPAGVTRIRRAACRAALAILVLAPPALGAQGAVRDTAPAPPTRSASAALVTTRDVERTGLLLLAAAAVSPFDGRITRASQRPSLQGIAPLRQTARALNLAGGAGLVVVPIAAWAVGRVAHDGALATTAVHTGEAIALGAAMTWVAKGAIGRARPYVVHDSDAARFRPGRGFAGGAYASLPSGHATAAWAAATILDRELRHYWPRGARIGIPAAYTGAALVSLARVYTDKHWASDVIAAAAVGTLAGRIVAHYHDAGRPDLLERIFLDGGVAATRDGPVAVFSYAF